MRKSGLDETSLSFLTGFNFGAEDLSGPGLNRGHKDGESVYNSDER